MKGVQHSTSQPILYRQDPPCCGCDWITAIVVAFLNWCWNLYQSDTVSILDAKDAGMTYEEVLGAVNELTNRELQDTLSSIHPSVYIRREYFQGISLPPGTGIPEAIYLAKKVNQVVGFLILAKKTAEQLDPNKGWISYLAVSSDCKRSGAGTKLMLTAMRKTVALGKPFAIVSYTERQPDSASEELKQRALARSRFYSMFTTKYGIPSSDERYLWRNGAEVPPEQATGLEEHSIDSCFDLRGVDLTAL